MPYYVTELRDSGGNDTTVYDLLIEAETTDAALDKAWAFIEDGWPTDEPDGGEGTFHPCVADNGWVIGECVRCHRYTYVEPHGITAACVCSPTWTDHIAVPYIRGDSMVSIPSNAWVPPRGKGMPSFTSWELRRYP